MRLLFILVTITLLTEAKKRRPERKKKMKLYEDDIPHEADVFPQTFVSVPFGHIYKEGFQPKAKMPVDLLELSRNYSKDYIENIQMNQQIKPRDDSIFLKETTEDKMDVTSDVKETKKDSTNNKKTWHDLVANQARNFGEARKSPSHLPPLISTKDTVSNLIPIDLNYKPKEQFLSRGSFNLELKRREDPLNWTTCDEFGRKVDFHPNDVVNINWVPFYTWAADQMKTYMAFIHRFSIPTVKMVQKYKEEFGNYLNKTLDWSSPKLYLKTNMEMLLIAADRKGGFLGIPYNEVPKPMKHTELKLPLLRLRLKILDPYLAMMYCDHPYASIMAVSGNEPNTIQEIRDGAAALKFQGTGYPVARNIEEEMTAARLERDSMIQKEKNMFLEDHFDFNFPIEV